MSLSKEDNFALNWSKMEMSSGLVGGSVQAQEALQLYDALHKEWN